MRRSTRLAAVALASAAFLLPLPAVAKSAGVKLPCTGNPAATARIDVGSTYGFYALPAKKPVGIVMYDHGYGHNAEDWREHLSQTAQRDGVIAVAMNYVADEGTTRRGWWVSEGADASIAAIAQRTGFPEESYFCRAFRRVVGSTPGAYRRQPGSP